MKSCDCMILDLPGHNSLVEFAVSACTSKVNVVKMKIEDLAEVEAPLGAELGTLIVPVTAGLDLMPIAQEITRLRRKGGHLRVLAVARNCPCAARMSLGEYFDYLVSAEWESTPELIRRFIASNRTKVQNRAFRAFLEHAVDGYWIWNVDDDHLEWSQRTAEMTGTPAQSIPGTFKDFADLIHPHDFDRVEQAVRNHLLHEAPYKNIEMRLRRADGSYGYFLANGQALRDETGRATILVGSLTDRTLMQRVEQQLEDTQKRFTVLFHQMNDAAVLADIETGIILEANQPAERLWGKSISELVGMHQSQLHPPILSEEAKKAFADHIAALMQNKRDSIHVPILRSDGTEVPAEISSSLIEMDGKLTILGVFRNISDRVRAERELRERDAQIQLSSHLASMGTLAAGVAHEINNPLTYVLGNLELVKVLLDDRGISDREIDEAIHAASTGGRYVREIVSDLKAISRMDSSENQCDPCEVIRIASRMAMSDLRHSANLEMSLAEVSPVPLSSARLSQVVLNILSNAARAFSNPGRDTNRIAITVRQLGDIVLIVIEDNGTGIAPDDLKRVWEPFFTKRSDKGGTGLGLSICRRILHEVAGTLELESEMGLGTKVKIRVPISGSARRSEPTQNSETTLSGSKRPRLLVVDDDEMVSRVIERMLRKDFDITVHNSALPALAELQGGREFDLVLCDIMMPEMDGPAFYAAVESRIPFLFLTGGAVTGHSIDFERRMLAEGRIMYKPFEVTTLRERLLACLEGTPQLVNAPSRLPNGSTAETLAELETVLGPEILRVQLRNLLGQLQELRAQARDITPDQMIRQAHKIAGGANVLGFTQIGEKLLRCEQALATGDVDLGRSELISLGDLPEFETLLSLCL